MSSEKNHKKPTAERKVKLQDVKNKADKALSAHMVPGVGKKAGKGEGSPFIFWLSWLFWPVVILYWEFLFKGCVGEAAIFDFTLFYIVLFSLGFGLFFTAVGKLIPSVKLVRVLRAVLLGVLAITYIAEFCVKQYYTTFYELNYMVGMSGSIAGNDGFRKDAFLTIYTNLWFFGLCFIPLIVFLIFRKKIVPEKRSKKGLLIAVILSLICTFLPATLLRTGAGRLSEDRPFYTYEYTVNGAIPRFGCLTDFRLEFQYMMFGRPLSPQEEVSIQEYSRIEVNTEDESSDVGQEEEEYPAAHDLKPYSPNVTNIDFGKLASSTSNSTLKGMHNYFGSVTPTYQNQYTGMFAGKNLIMICGEAFCGYAIDEEVTPTLYKLYSEGFVFDNYYQPNWGQSTTGGEFSMLTGLVPTWVNGGTSFEASYNDAMPVSLANLLKKQGYRTMAYHDGDYEYYSRNLTHPNLGYTFKALGNGLKLKNSSWPNSDIEMMQATVPDLISTAQKTGKPFHAYYMTISGHANYTWGGNSMAAKNKDYIKSFSKLSHYHEAVQGYLATQYEVDRALTYLLEQLEKAGMLEDTVICMTGDHYPYNLWQKRYNYSYSELSHTSTEKDLNHYRNALILWSGSMKEPVVIDDPCSSIDIIPTLCNLFGLSYDSRLYMGRDLLDQSYDLADAKSRQPLAVFPDGGHGYSWISVVGEFNSFTNTYTAHKGYEDLFTSAYKTAMQNRAKGMFTNSRLIITDNYYKYIGK